ncbi:MAG: hypothetical protein FWD03_03120 [Defluviitaleaceae bacterium]|nr:hypothetical protein [Defluviitaleaceae bacterium]
MSVVIGNEADVLFFPYNSEVDSVGGRDRLYDSQDWADYFRQFIGNGVYPNPATGLRVDSLHNSNVLTVRMGAAFLQGRFYLQKRDFEFPVDPAHLTLGRRDIVVCRHNIITRTTMLHYIAGTPASNPQVPPLMRTNDVFDLQLCTITVNPNAQAITQANILDTRANNAVCGFVTGVVQQVDTTDLFNQYSVYLNQQIAFWNQSRDTWAAEQNAWTNEMHLLIQAMETQSFDLINNNFDDWSVRRGCDKTTVFNADGSITEAIRVVAADFVLATKNTVFNADGSITETITFNPWEMAEGYITALTTKFTITKRTVFNADGSIREEIR